MFAVTICKKLQNLHELKKTSDYKKIRKQRKTAKMDPCLSMANKNTEYVVL